MDVSFLLGPLLAPVLTIVAVAIIVAVRRIRWAVRLGMGLAGLTTVTWLTYWFLWGKAFDFADSGGKQGWDVQGVTDAVSVVCASACAALLGTAVLAFQRSRGAARGAD